MRNNKGPKMEPCGMPYLIFRISDLSLLMVVAILSSVTEIAFEPIKMKLGPVLKNATILILLPN